MEIYAQKLNEKNTITLLATCSVKRNMIYDPFESKDKIPVDEKAEIIFVLDTQFISEDKKLFSKVKHGILKALRDIPVDYKYNFIALGNDIAEMWKESQYATEVNC